MTETTTEPTTLTLHERLAKVQYSKNKRPTATYWGVALEDVAAIERELIDAATVELRERIEELEIYKSTYAKELSACGTTIAQLREEVERLTKLVATWGLVAMERRAKHDALKDKADALRDAAYKVSGSSKQPVSEKVLNRLGDAIADYDAAEPHAKDASMTPDEFAEILMHEFGGPTENESMHEMAIRLLRGQRSKLAKADTLRNEIAHALDAYYVGELAIQAMDSAIATYDGIEKQNAVTDEQVRKIGLEVFGRHRAAEPKETHDLNIDAWHELGKYVQRTTEGLAGGWTGLAREIVKQAESLGIIPAGAVTYPDWGNTLTFEPGEPREETHVKSRAEQHASDIQSILAAAPSPNKETHDGRVCGPDAGQGTQVDVHGAHASGHERGTACDGAGDRNEADVVPERGDATGALRPDGESAEGSGATRSEGSDEPRAGEADAAEAVAAPSPDRGWEPGFAPVVSAWQDPALQARPHKERIDDLVTRADAATKRMDSLTEVTKQDWQAIKRAETRLVKIEGRLDEQSEWMNRLYDVLGLIDGNADGEDALTAIRNDIADIERFQKKFRKRAATHESLISNLDGAHETTNVRLNRLEAEREPGAVPTAMPDELTTKMCHAFWAAFAPDAGPLVNKDDALKVFRGLEAALKAGGAK